MLGVLSRYWWVLVVRGVLAILFGIIILVSNPAVTLRVLVTLFGAYAIVDGIFTIISGISDRDTNNRWWATVVEGVVSIIAGVLVFVLGPGITAIVLLYVVAGWAIVTGIFEVIAAIRLREEIEGEFWLGLTGVLSVLFGILLLIMNPAEGIVTLLWLVAVYSIAFGVFMLILGFRLRGMGPTSATPTTR